jgi:hypothetical protein
MVEFLQVQTAGTHPGVTMVPAGSTTVPDHTGWFTPPSHPNVCPGCGRCKHCGRYPAPGD